VIGGLIGLAILVVIAATVGQLVSPAPTPNHQYDERVWNQAPGSTASELSTQQRRYQDASGAANQGDYATALRIIRPLAEQGHAKAQSFLGMIYDEGWGVPRNHAEAMKWFSRAADQRDWGAQVQFAVMYRDGTGVPKDYIRAYMWFDLAAQSTEPADAPGHYTPAQAAAIFRDDVAQFMTPAQIAEARKLAKDWKPGAAQ
jgi:TPR repeat protein